MKLHTEKKYYSVFKGHSTSYPAQISKDRCQFQSLSQLLPSLRPHKPEEGKKIKIQHFNVRICSSMIQLKEISFKGTVKCIFPHQNFPFLLFSISECFEDNGGKSKLQVQQSSKSKNPNTILNINGGDQYTIPQVQQFQVQKLPHLSWVQLLRYSKQPLILNPQK